MNASKGNEFDTSWDEPYRDKLEWDSIYWGSHCVDCYPGSCPMKVHVRDGKVVREEQAGSFNTIEVGVPDFNPMGCQKGACWSQSLYGPDRLLYPLKRAGERGEGKWQRVTWDDALTEGLERCQRDRTGHGEMDRFCRWLRPYQPYAGRVATGARVPLDALRSPVRSWGRT